MDITWFGHSCFRIKGKEATIITDPCSPETGYSLNKMKADIVTISHNHSSHSYISAIEGEFKKIDSPGEYELKGIFITGIPTYHDKVEGKELGKNIVFVMEIDGVVLCHLGDIGDTLSSKIIEDIGDIGILFLPVGGLTTIDSTTAADLIRNLSPKIVIPMHYKTAAASGNLEPLERFLKKLGIKEVASLPKLTITRTTFTENTQIIVLNYPENSNSMFKEK